MNTMKPHYIIQRWPLGWVLCPPSIDIRGIPMDALNECLKLFPKNSVIETGICHHLRETSTPEAVICIATPANAKKWREHILKAIAGLPPQDRWWKGLDVGCSSAAIFAVLGDLRFTAPATRMSRQSVPSDAADFGRCSRLIQLFPEWKAQLQQVAEAYPTTRWPAIVARWDELEAATPEEQSRILSTLA
jgi:hypothetical protein